MSGKELSHDPSGIRSHTLVEAYESHDGAQEYITAKLESAGYVVDQHGTDDRYADDARYGHGPDCAVRPFEGGPIVGFIETKSKTLNGSVDGGDYWYGGLNERHLTEYIDAEGGISGDNPTPTDAPVVVFMCVIDDGNVIREGFFPVTEASLSEKSEWSQGNKVVWFDNDDERNFNYVVNEVFDA